MAFVAVTLHCMRSIWKENDDSRGHKTLGTPYLLQSPIQPGAAKMGKNSFWSSMFYFDMPRDFFENLEIYQRLKIWKISRENEGCLKKCLLQRFLFFIMSARKRLIQISKYGFLIGRHSNLDQFLMCWFDGKREFWWRNFKVSLLGVDSLWGDCTFIPADWGS